jgi:hypothetical protein
MASKSRKRKSPTKGRAKRATKKATKAAAKKTTKKAVKKAVKKVAAKAAKRGVKRAAGVLAGLVGAAIDPIVQKLQDLIAAGKIIFDSDTQRKQLLGLNTGTKVTRKAQSLVLKLSELAGQTIRISSLVRVGDPGHHGSGRAVDIGNEEIAGTLLPRVATNAQVAALEIDELIFDAAIAGETDRNKWNYDRGVKHDYNPATLNQHRNHIHFAVKL